MKRYILRRLLWAIPTFFGAITILFLLMNVVPGDIAMVILSEESGLIDPVELEALRESLGLNRPIYIQYFSWLGGLLQGDLGISLWTGQPVTSEIAVRIPYTGALVIYALMISIITAVPIGVISALRQDGWLDYTLRSIVIAGLSIPNFFFGMMMLYLTVSLFRYFPPLEYATIWTNPWIALQQLTMPAIVLGFRASAASARMMRSSMLEVMREDYVRTASAKGLLQRNVIYVHALKNAILPVVTMFGIEIAFLFSGSVIIETIFNIPGIGLLLIDAINRRDIIMVQGVVATIMILILLINIAVDLMYAWIDPRVRLR